jgi:hypothetical protein
MNTMMHDYITDGIRYQTETNPIFLRFLIVKQRIDQYLPPAIKKNRERFSPAMELIPPAKKFIVKIAQDPMHFT